MCAGRTYESSGLVYPKVFKTGDHLFQNRGAYAHHLIVVGRVGTSNKYYVIDFAKCSKEKAEKGEGANWKKINIALNCIDLSTDENEVGKVNYPRCHSPARTLAMAYNLTQQDDIKYSLWHRNCEHLATMCKTGAWKSNQIHKVKFRLFDYVVCRSSLKFVFLIVLRIFVSAVFITYDGVHIPGMGQVGVDLVVVILIPSLESVFCAVEIIWCLCKNRHSVAAEQGALVLKQKAPGSVEIYADVLEDYFCNAKCGKCKLRTETYQNICKVVSLCFLSIISCLLSIIVTYEIFYNCFPEKWHQFIHNNDCKIANYVTMFLGLAIFIGSLLAVVIFYLVVCLIIRLRTRRKCFSKLFKGFFGHSCERICTRLFAILLKFFSCFFIFLIFIFAMAFCVGLLLFFGLSVHH